MEEMPDCNCTPESVLNFCCFSCAGECSRFSAGLLLDPRLDPSGLLTLTGTDRDDHVRIRRQGNNVEVVVNGRSVASAQIPADGGIHPLHFRVPVDQGLQLFTALRRNGVPSEGLVFENEGHWVLNALDSRRWHETVFAWMHKYLAPVTP